MNYILYFILLLLLLELLILLLLFVDYSYKLLLLLMLGLTICISYAHKYKTMEHPIKTIKLNPKHTVHRIPIIIRNETKIMAKTSPIVLRATQKLMNILSFLLSTLKYCNIIIFGIIR